MPKKPVEPVAIADLEAQAQKMGVDTEGIKERLAVQNPNATQAQYMGLYNQALTAATSPSPSFSIDGHDYTAENFEEAISQRLTDEEINEYIAQADATGLMAIVTAVVHIVRAIHSRKQLEQKRRFVRAATAEVPEGLVWGQIFELGNDRRERFVPGDGLIVILAATHPDGLRDPAAGFELARREGLQLRNRIRRPKLGPDAALNVGGHRLQALLADFGEVSRLVHHAALLAAHAERAGFTGVLRTHGLPEFEEAAGLA